MQYLKVDLAINDEGEDYKDEYKTWLEIYPKIANKERADDAGYFFAVRELKIVNEGSMVLFGSNDATPIKDNEAVSDTSIKEPSKDTQITVTQMLQKINV
jgi:translation elongation factor EF-Tu-like GTPase